MAQHRNGEIKIKKLAIAPFGTNCYLVACPRTKEGVIIDTPGEPERILAEAEGTKVRYILITHTHQDHLGAFSQIRARLGVPVAVHPLEASRLPSPPNLALNDGDMLSLGTLKLRVIHTPGHTPGSICLLSGKHLFSGDTIFPHGPGKTGTPAHFEQIVRSITEKLFPLPHDTIVYPGHGENTVLGREKEEFTQFASRPRTPGLCGDVLWLSS
jgi:glyoxylase-like metal-dependent hydrolase (beta-lactamase superfamily II)